MSINKNKIERAAVRAVEEYIDSCSRLEPAIQSNDKTPIWDGDIYIYDNTERHKVEDFSALVRLQIKGTTTAESSSFRIDRVYVEAYKAEMGTVLLVHQQREGSSKLLYAILTLKKINALLQQSTKTIKIDLTEVPANPPDFEKELIRFAKERRAKPIENPAPEEITDLVNHFKDLKQFLDKDKVEFVDNGVKIELKSFLSTITSLENEGTVGWRDTFVYLARKVLDLTILYVKAYDTLNLQFELARYLHHQRLYHLIEDYYLQALKEYRERAKTDSTYKADVAKVLNSLGCLHSETIQFDAAKDEFKEALGIYMELSEDNSDTHLSNVAMTLTNLGIMNSKCGQYAASETNFKQALEIYKELNKNNSCSHLADTALILYNLGTLHIIVNQYTVAEKDFKKALEIYKKLAGKNSETYLPEVSMTQNNLALTHLELNCYTEAESEFKEALKNFRKLAEDNQEVYLAKIAETLNHSATLHYFREQFITAESELKEELEIYKKLAKDNPEVYLWKKADALLDFAYFLLLKTKRKEEAKQNCQEALDIFTELAKKTPQRFNHYVNIAHRMLNDIKKST